MKMVLLAAGHGRRFGGLKQLAPVGDGGEALIDFTVQRAQRAGFDGIVLVVREEIRGEMERHVASAWPSSLPVDVVVQGPEPGTVPAVLAATAAIDGPFAVANADDLYDETALKSIVRHFRGDSERQVLVGYRLANTVLTSQPVKRGLCVLDEHGDLRDLVEHHVLPRPDGAFDASPLFGGDEAASRVLLGDEPVSMNLWGFHNEILALLEEAAAKHRRAGTCNPQRTPAELLLPEVLGRQVRHQRARIRVVETGGCCIGLTHRDDLPLVRAALARVILPAQGATTVENGRELAPASAMHERASRADLASA